MRRISDCIKRNSNIVQREHRYLQGKLMDRFVWSGLPSDHRSANCSIVPPVSVLTALDGKPRLSSHKLYNSTDSSISEPQSQDIYAHPNRTPTHAGSPITPTFKRYLDPYEAQGQPASPNTPTRSPPVNPKGSWLSGFSLRRASGISQAASHDGSFDDGDTPLADMNDAGRTLWGR